MTRRAAASAPKQTVSTLPKGFAGTSFTSEVSISPDARFVYAANRLHDTIASLSIGGDGKLIFAGEEWTRGDYPRSFTIDPSGTFLYTCNQRGDAIACFRVTRKTGALTFTGHYTPVGTPPSLCFDRDEAQLEGGQNAGRSQAFEPAWPPVERRLRA